MEAERTCVDIALRNIQQQSMRNIVQRIARLGIRARAARISLSLDVALPVGATRSLPSICLAVLLTFSVSCIAAYRRLPGFPLDEKSEFVVTSAHLYPGESGNRIRIAARAIPSNENFQFDFADTVTSLSSCAGFVVISAGAEETSPTEFSALPVLDLHSWSALQSRALTHLGELIRRSKGEESLKERLLFKCYQSHHPVLYRSTKTVDEALKSKTLTWERLRSADATLSGITVERAAMNDILRRSFLELFPEIAGSSPSRVLFVLSKRAEAEKAAFVVLDPREGQFSVVLLPGFTEGSPRVLDVRESVDASISVPIAVWRMWQAGRLP